MRVARLRPRARAREKGGRSKQSACGNRSVARSLSLATCIQSVAVSVSCTRNVIRPQDIAHAQSACVAITPGFHALAIKARAVQQRLPLQELRALAPPHPLLSVSSAAAAPLTDLPATQLLPPLPPPLLALCVRGRHHPAGWLLRLTSTDARLVSSSLIRPTTTDSEMPLMTCGSDPYWHRAGDHLPVSIPGVMILTCPKFRSSQWRCCTQKACFRGRTRDSGTQSQIAAGSPWQNFGGPARRI